MHGFVSALDSSATTTSIGVQMANGHMELVEHLEKWFQEHGITDSYNLAQAVVGMVLASDEVYTRSQVDILLNEYRREIAVLKEKL